MPDEGKGAVDRVCSTLDASNYRNMESESNLENYDFTCDMLQFQEDKHNWRI